MSAEKFRMLSMLLVGSLLGAVVYAQISSVTNSARAQPANPSVKPPADLQALAAEIEAIKQKLPDQSHAMQDVAYHFSNLWFAEQNENWDLAKFYWSETRSHLRWAVRIIPKRKYADGQILDLEGILGAVENTPLKHLEDAIKSKDKVAFEKAYRFTIDSCYSCHKAAEKPFLRPQIPTQPESRIINLDPKSDWPK